jgi:hypothetical protein
MSGLAPLTSGCNRPLQMTFEDQINILVYFHLEEHHSGRHLLQVLKENHFAHQYITPKKGISKSSFFEDISSCGLEQMLELFEKLYVKAATQLPKGHAELGCLAIIDGSLIDSVLSMYWADYRNGSKKAKVHIGFDLNRGIPKKIFLISRSKSGLMIQMLDGLITYILLAIYCHNEYNEIIKFNSLIYIGLQYRFNGCLVNREYIYLSRKRRRDWIYEILFSLNFFLIFVLCLSIEPFSIPNVSAISSVFLSSFIKDAIFFSFLQEHIQSSIYFLKIFCPAFELTCPFRNQDIKVFMIFP